MIFKVVQRSRKDSSHQPHTILLVLDNWNDFSYYTYHHVIYIDSNLQYHEIGGVRIGYFGQEEGSSKKKLVAGDEFYPIANYFFSLGAGTEYYENLNRFSPEIREQLLEGLRDIAFLPNVLEDAQHEDVTQTSLFRGLDIATVKGQYRRMALGGAKLTSFKFWFESPRIDSTGRDIKLFFNVIPESNPPTNVHVLIGRNGVGKTTMIENMIASLENEASLTSKGVYFSTRDDKFVNVISVSFSAFDSIKPRFDVTSEYTLIDFKYIGLKSPDDSDLGFKIKTSKELSDEFIKSFQECKESFKLDKLRKCLKALESDPNFKEVDIPQLIPLKKKQIESIGKELFNKLSSGHKIILLSITRLVETIQEKSLVFIDEPEAHLHPPLLSAFTRSLSELLVTVNGVAIIATHSPVILQEVPTSCSYMLDKIGSTCTARRPDIETFGENVGVLTREVFGLEVTDSGFYQLLRKAVNEVDSYDDLIDLFDDQLGMEARSIARVLFSKKQSAS